MCVLSYSFLQDSLPLTEVEIAFDTSVESIGNRDCRIQRVSALRGYVGVGVVYLLALPTSEGVAEGIEWLAHRVKEKSDRPSKQVRT